MALKRAADVDVSICITEAREELTSIPPLKLRIKETCPSTSYHVVADISNSLRQNDRLTALMRLSETPISLFSADDGEQLLRVLKDSLRKEDNPVIRGRILLVLKDILKIPNLNRLVGVDDLIDPAQKESNHNVFVQYLRLFSTVGQLIPSKADIIQKILKLAYKKLTDSHQDVRCLCLQLLSQLCPKDGMKMSGGRFADFPDLFCEFSIDQDPRVRASSLQALLALHHRGQSLDLNVYEKASNALLDDYEEVRMAAVKIIWVMSHIYPERMVLKPSDETIRLVDDGFIKICNMVNDGCMKVRAEAMGLLGSLHLVSFVFLEQTLDKKLMSHLRKKKSYHEKERERFLGSSESSSSTWSTGRKWGDNEPPIDSSSDEDITLMSIGACGAFVRGLEDEFKEVRGAAVDSLCELANQNSAFAAMSCDFLVDMFNDEIESVRLNSINSLIKICQHVDLREEQLDTMFNVLSDYNWEIREGIRELLAHCRLSTRACLHATALALMQNLKKYPNDKSHIWRCMKILGQRNSEAVASLVPDLLTTHPYYAVPEPNLDDHVYTAVAILVFNAAVNSPTIRSLLPEHIKRHYDYLRDSLPELVPELRMNAGVASHRDDTGDNDIELFYKTTLIRAQSLGSCHLSAATNTLESCIKDFNHVERASSRLAPNAHFQSLYIKCINLLYKVRAERTWTIPTPITAENSGFFTSTVKELLSLSYQLENAFLGLSSQESASVKLIRVLAHCLQMVLTSRSSSIKSMDRKQHDLDCLQLFLDRIKHFRETISSTDLANDAGFQSILNCEKILEEGSYSMTKAVSYLQNLLLNCAVKTLEVENPLREIRAKIIEPMGSSDTVLRFTAGLTLGVNLHCTLENIDDTSDVFVMVIYPDLQSHLFKPRSADFRRLGRLKHRLVTSLLISHDTWSESSCVQISIVLKHATDVDEENVLAFLKPKRNADKIIRTSDCFKNDITRGFLSICKPVKLTVQPRATHK